MRRVIKASLIIFGIIGLACIAGIYSRYGGGSTDFPDLSTTPTQNWKDVETVAELDTPPGNIAVSMDNRVFITLHPEAMPEIHLAEIIDGTPVAYPNRAAQALFHAPLSVRIDQQNRLWILDTGLHGYHPVTLRAFDLATGEIVHEVTLPETLFGLGSHANDFQVSPDGETLFIADASILALTPAIVVYHVGKRSARRVLSGHDIMKGDNFTPIVNNRIMSVAGVFDVRPGVDGIALDREGKWLYFAPITELMLYRIPAHALTNPALTNDDLMAYLEIVGQKTMTDGMTIDHQERIYLSDIEHNAIIRMDLDGNLETLLKDDQIQWPDGFSFGPNGWLYFTNSALHHVIGKLPSNVANHAPYRVYRFKPEGMTLESPISLSGH